MVNVFGGKGSKLKNCINCRYAVKRRTGSFNTGFGVSNWMFCEGNKGVDLTGRGVKFLGLVHKNMVCQLPNVGKEADWKPIVRAPAGMKKARPYSAHPNSVGQFASKDESYEREWHLERMRELENG